MNRRDEFKGVVREEYVKCSFCGVHYNIQRGHTCR